MGFSMTVAAFDRAWKWLARQVKELLPYAPIH
jgi:hypothetical protein